MRLLLTRSVCVFCGSRRGNDPAHAAAAAELGTALAGAGLRLVYGAGDVGLMGVLASAAIAAGGETLGVVPAHLVGRERGARDLTRVVVTETMHERKKVMFMNADAIVTLPGGGGSLDELFEVLTWRQLGLHDKHVYLLNVNGYWNPLLALLVHIVAEGFAPAEVLGYLEPCDSVPELMGRLAALPIG
ncbi:TIGR00730 family Rossman fold protein [Amaricoccus sp.]|uniref:LOG family protein n=1 Tax=Amaricoccus sp. TaxID=1872485 RepID=UPI00263219D4|nr:TIGR00730 family Rossman fold protein [Amaricoccus sp.]HRO11104.1 TIGR00730 family Rossman fold protein [Amaricoccus sp.]